MDNLNKFCIFDRKNGDVIYNDISLIDGDTKRIHGCDNKEYIDSGEIYMDCIMKVFYHKQSYNFETDSPIHRINDNNSKYLIWKQTRNDDYDWFLNDKQIDEKKLVNVKEFKKINTKKELLNKIDHLKLKTEIMTNVYIIGIKYNLNSDNSIILTKLIEDTLDKHIITYNTLN